jgi:hypothetical protein
MTIAIRTRHGITMASGSFFVDDDAFELQLKLEESAPPLKLSVEFRTDSNLPPNQFRLEGLHPDSAKLTFLNYLGVEQGIGPYDFGSYRDRKMTVFMWVGRLHEKIRRIEYTFYIEEPVHG